MSAPPSYADVAAPSNTSNGHLSNKQKTDVGYDLVGRAIDDYPPGKPYSIALKEYPETYEKKVYVPGPDDPLIDAGTARATLAATHEHPNGTTEDNWAKDHSHQLVLTQHAQFFDRDQDGVIWPLDTYKGFRDLGWNFFLAAFGTFLINFWLSYPSQPSILPDPFFRIYVHRMNRLKHGSDSMTFDAEGRFRPQQFEDFFSKYDKDNKGGLTFPDFITAWRGQMFVFDLFGWSATFFEWLGVYVLLWPEDGVMKKEDVRRVFDGSIFYKIAEEQRAKKESRKKK